MRNRLWIGLPVITLPDGNEWAVLSATAYAMSKEYVLKLKRGWEERTVVIGWDDYNGLLSPESNPQQRFDLHGVVEEDTPAPSVEVWSGEIQHSQLCIASGERRCHKSCTVLRWYRDQDPSAIEHSQECLESETELDDCPVSQWYYAHGLEMEIK